MSDAIEEFGPYIVYEQLGQGGMATVHRAEKRGVGIRRPIALKRLLPHVAADPDLVKLFVDEARLASQLHHANVAQTYELGRVGDTFFIAMEFASGPTLSQIIRQCQRAVGDIPLPVTVNILAQVCEALDYAHNLCDEAGRPLRIIHRDVSPANILVTNAGIVKLIDFGIAKATISSVKTQTGFIKGKYGYIAPEYITGKIDHRVDLFAVGVVAHEMIAGRRLFEGKDDFETLANIRDLVMEPPSHWNPAVTRDLDDIVMTALQRDPDKRWQSAGAMQVALAGVAREFGQVVGSQQVVEWVEWAFTQVPQPSESMQGMDPNTAETVIGGYDPVALGDSNLSIVFERIPKEFRDPATPRPGVRQAPFDRDETVPLDRVRHVFNSFEVLTPPGIAAARAANLPPPEVAASRVTARLPMAKSVAPPAPSADAEPTRPVTPWRARGPEPAGTDVAPPAPAPPRAARSATPVAPDPPRLATSTPNPPRLATSTPSPPRPTTSTPGPPLSHPPPPSRSARAVDLGLPQGQSPHGIPEPAHPFDTGAMPTLLQAPRTLRTPDGIPRTPSEPAAPREIAMVVVPPGTNFDLPLAPPPLAPSAPSVSPPVAPRVAPGVAIEKRTVAPPAPRPRPGRSPGNYPIAPRKPPLPLWLIALMIMLATCAAAVAYVWHASQ